MANEYGELEQMVNDVTSLDTARMTLRWALERLNTIEKEKADLKKGLTLAEETAKRLQVKEASLQDAYSSRNKTLEEKEDFYTKLEATMSLLGEGKLDIQQLLKKEAKLDGLRKSLEAEYADKFEELDRSQRSIIERWNARLLEVESQYAGKLAESQKKYDSLRAELEADHQGRLASLEAGFKAREKDLSARVRMLEDNALHAEEKVEVRRRELEAEYLSKKKEIEGNYRKLKGLLESGLDERLRAMDSDHAAQVRSLEASWQTERARLLDEQRVRDEQYFTAQARIKEIENALASQQEVHHNELLKMITEKENAFRAQLAELEKEKSAKEETVKELVSRLEKKAADWEAEKACLESEFGGRIAMMEKSLREREAALEREYDERKARFENSLEEKQRELDAAAEKHGRELMARVQAGEASFREKLEAFEAERRSYNETIGRLTSRIEEAARAAAGEKENFRLEIARISAMAEAQAQERNALVREEYESRKADLEKDFAGRYADRLKAVEAEKSRLSEALAEREKQMEAAFGESRRLDTALAELRMKTAEEKAELSREYEAEMNGALKEAENASRAREAALAADIEALRGELTERNRLLAEEKGRLVDELSKASIEAHNRGEERAEAVKSEYCARLASLEAAAEAREEELRQAIAEKETLLERTLREKAENETFLKSEFERKRAELEAALAARAEALEADHAARRERLESELSARAAALNSEAEAKLAFERKNWQAERGRYEGQLEEISGKFRASQKEIENISAGLRRAAEENAAREAGFNKELMEAKANYDRELTFRVKDAVSVQTAHLVEALEVARRKQEEMSAAIEAKDNSIAALRAEAAQARREFEETLASAGADAVAARRAEMEEDLKLRREAMAADFEMKDSRLAEENEAMKDALAEMNAAAAEANARSAELSSRLLAAEKAAAAEKLEMQKEQMRELDAAVSGAVAAAMEEMERKLLAANAELERVRKEGVDEVRHIKEVYAAEKERIFEEMDRRERYIESADIKIQELEREMMKYRQSASGELMKQISEQDERFRTLVAAEKARNEARVKQLESLLSAKEKMLTDADKFYRQKQLELDSLHASLNQRVSEFNEDLFAQKQALGEKERALNDHRLKLEKDYSVRAAELEQMKAELSRAIMEYKGRK
ncbi:MAG: coiled-coil domain-containing protein [Elusimicrobiales bacterium]